MGEIRDLRQKNLNEGNKVIQ